MKTIKIDCKAAENLTIDQLEPFQGELKELSRESYENLRDEILNTGFAFPFHVWQNDGKNYIIGGHQRLRVLQTLQNQGYDIPPVPVSIVFADSYELAKRRILQDIAVHGSVSQQGLYQFSVEWGIKPVELAKLKIPEINMPTFIENFFGKPEDDVGVSEVASVTEPQRVASNDVKQVQLFFDAETHAKFLQYCKSLGEKYQTDNVTDTVFRVMEWQYGNP